MSDAYIAALRILNYRFNSEAELRRKLRRKQFAPDEIDSAIERLRREKWLDDERFAGAFVRTRSNKRIGRLRILRELHAAGVSDEAASRAVAENVDPEKEAAALKAAAERRARILVRRHGPEILTTDEGRNKLAVYLLNQGYDAALVYAVLKEIRVVHHQPDS
ncbi:MAG: regulatory protein RecX [Thermoanaerobaculia bacterium]